MGPLLHEAMGATCPHGAPITVVSKNVNVMVNGTKVASMTDLMTIGGCPFQIPVGAGTKPQPCVTANIIVPASRVLINGQPAVLLSSTGIAKSVEQIPQGPPIFSVAQPRVIAT